MNEWTNHFITGHFSGPSRALDLLCVCVWTTFERIAFDLDI